MLRSVTATRSASPRPAAEVHSFTDPLLIYSPIFSHTDATRKLASIGFSVSDRLGFDFAYTALLVCPVSLHNSLTEHVNSEIALGSESGDRTKRIGGAQALTLLVEQPSRTSGPLCIG